MVTRKARAGVAPTHGSLFFLPCLVFLAVVPVPCYTFPITSVFTALPARYVARLRFSVMRLSWFVLSGYTRKGLFYSGCRSLWGCSSHRSNVCSPFRRGLVGACTNYRRGGIPLIESRRPVPLLRYRRGFSCDRHCLPQAFG